MHPSSDNSAGERSSRASTPPARTTSRGGRSPTPVFAAGAAVLSVSTAAMLAGVEPFASWYYHFAWLGALLMGDAVVAWTGGAGERGRFLLLNDAARTASLFFWSAVIWLFFEAINLRIQNWYYVFLPRDTAVRWIGEFVAFGTVLPAVLVAEAVLNGAGVARGVRWRPVRLGERRLRALPLIGCTLLVLPLIWPRYFFPLVWLGLAPILEPFVYRRAPERSLLADFERGEPGRLLRLLAGGAAIGLIWELFNIAARTKWIYTVPGFAEAPRLFEMPVLGFFGFPPFAVECFVLWQALAVAGLAGARARPTRVRTAVYAIAAAGSLAVLAAMDGRTVDSLRPTIDGLPGMPPLAAQRLGDAGYDAFRLAEAEPAVLVAEITTDQAGVVDTRPAAQGPIGAGSAAVDHTERGATADPRDAAAWVAAARLATFRGIGTEHASALATLGVTTIHDLARADAAALARDLHRQGAAVPFARVRVWVFAAKRHAGSADP